MTASPAPLVGLVLAAGEGTRFGGPKSLARDAEGTPWVALAVRMLRGAGCDEVVVLLGASGERARTLVPPEGQTLMVGDGADGLSASLRAGMAAASTLSAEAVLITPVDTPSAPVDAARRVIEQAGKSLPAALARAVYLGRPGHPVLIGREHWEVLAETLSGDAGAGAYLWAHGAVQVECGDLWSGEDIDRR